MNVSHASIHPMEDPLPPPLPAAAAAAAAAAAIDGGNVVANEGRPRGVRMKDIQGMPGTTGGLVLRCCQFVFAVASLSVMATTGDFPSVTAFSYLVAAAGLQTLWSLSLAITDGYALLVKRCLQNYQIVTLFAIGDGITSTLTFAAACASAGITVLIDSDLDICAQNHCIQFQTATAMAFISWFCSIPSFVLNFWSLASR